MTRRLPIRINFAGSWLDSPAHAVDGAFVVNCTVHPAALDDGSAVFNPKVCKVGWQETALLAETGLCVWRSGDRPVLESKHNPDWLCGLLALQRLLPQLKAEELVHMPRNYAERAEASRIAAKAASERNVTKLAEAVNMEHNAELEEGFSPVPSALNALAYKYAGTSGYAVYLFSDRISRDRFCSTGAVPVEPYIANVKY